MPDVCVCLDSPCVLLVWQVKLDSSLRAPLASTSTMDNAAPTLSIQDIKSLTVPKLKAELTRLNQPVSGLKRKAQLVDALTVSFFREWDKRSLTCYSAFYVVLSSRALAQCFGPLFRQVDGATGTPNSALCLVLARCFRALCCMSSIFCHHRAEKAGVLLWIARPNYPPNPPTMQAYVPKSSRVCVGNIGSKKRRSLSQETKKRLARTRPRRNLRYLVHTGTGEKYRPPSSPTRYLPSPYLAPGPSGKATGKAAAGPGGRARGATRKPLDVSPN